MPAFNASETIVRSILSVWFQTHDNWKIIIRDDCSTDGTPEVVESLKSQLGLGDDRVSLTVNDEKHWEIRNIVEALKECESDDIVCRLDGDDWLCDCDALALSITDIGQQNAMSSGRPIDGLSPIKIYQDPYRVTPIHTTTHGSPLTSRHFEKSSSRESRMKTLEDLTDLILSA